MIEVKNSEVGLFRRLGQCILQCYGLSGKGSRSWSGVSSACSNTILSRQGGEAPTWLGDVGFFNLSLAGRPGAGFFRRPKVPGQSATNS